MIVVMYVVKVPNRGSPPAILLRESYREDGKVKNRTLATCHTQFISALVFFDWSRRVSWCRGK